MDQIVLNDLCRLCVTKSDIFFNIFSPDGRRLQIKDKLNSLFPFQILEDEPTTTTICLTCYSTVDHFYDFYSRVLDKQSYFDNALADIDFLATDALPVAVAKIPNELCESLNFTEPSTTIVNSMATVPKVTHEISELYGNAKVSAHCFKQDILDFDHLQNPTILDENIPNIDNESQSTGALVDSFLRMSSISHHSASEHQNNQENIKHDQPLESNTKKLSDRLPGQLKIRMSKSESDAKIKEFVKLVCNVCTGNHLHRSFKELMYHFQTKHKQPGYVLCCDKKFYRKDRLMNHITNHIDPEAFKCPDCGQSRKSKILLRIHMKQHLPAENRKYQCEKCRRRFVLKSQLTNHEASHLTNDQKKFVCEICDKAFALKFVMVKHKLTHSLERNFVCDICAKSFTSKSNLTAHMAHHQPVTSPRVQCPMCQLWYKNADTLRTHLHRHRDQRRHICDTCQKECSTRSALAAHIRYVHLKVQQFECTICLKRFRRRLELTEHQARHTGETLYRCPFCPKTFASNSNYFSHRKNRHPTQFALVDKDKKLKSSEQPVA